jgi:hypothetical protein
MGAQRIWVRRERAGGTETVVHGEQHLQVRKFDDDVVIDPMNATLDGTQFKFIIQFFNVTRVYESEWSTVRLGKNVSVTVNASTFRVQYNRSVGIPVTGLPTPTVVLKDSANFSIDRYQLKGDMLMFGPVELSDHGITYSLTVFNCFHSVTASFAIDVLSKLSPVGCG